MLISLHSTSPPHWVSENLYVIEEEALNSLRLFSSWKLFRFLIMNCKELYTQANVSSVLTMIQFSFNADYKIKLENQSHNRKSRR